MRDRHILVAGDVVPIGANREPFIRGDRRAILGDELSDRFAEADIRIVNLETPLTRPGQPLAKHGPALRADPETIAGLEAIGVDLVCLANNHILDFGTPGLDSTFRLLDKAGISHVGAGPDAEASASSHLIGLGGTTIGVHACAEHEFSIATGTRPGACAFDPYRTPARISELRSRCDHVLVLYHGGRENHRYPTPGLRDACRALADAGADVVICQHSHCIGCEERYGSSVIVYGQGNFLFDRSSREEWKTGLVVDIVVAETLRPCYIPVIVEAGRTRCAEGERKRAILEGFEARSAEILVPGAVERRFDVLAETAGMEYLRMAAGFGRIRSSIDRRTKGMLVRLAFPPARRRALLNFVECESHREILSRYLSREDA